MEIVRDTREQVGFFTFASYADVQIVEKKLDTGDYSITGFEDKVTIDRKKNSGELYLNLGAQSTRINKELERMSKFERAYFVCAFPRNHLDIFPKESGIPPYRWKYLKMTSKYLKLRIHQIEEIYPNISFIFCNDVLDAERVTYELLKEYADDHE